MKKIILSVLAIMMVAVAFAQEENEEFDRDLSVQCGGVERWSVKTLTDVAATTVNYTPVNATIDSLINLPVPISYFYMPRVAAEKNTYSILCNITIKKVESDNDYHLVISDGTHTMIAESPDPACSAAAVSAHVNQYTAVRNWINAHIASGNVNNVNLQNVVVTGVAYLDTMHGQTGAAPNQMEIHPMLDIHFASVTGIVPVKEKLLSLSISPNPSNGKFNIKMENNKFSANDISIEIYTVLGEKIYADANFNQQLVNEIDLDHPAKGIYFLKLNDGTAIYNTKIIVE